ncbi:signal peptidase I [Paenibacillus phoenicis]|uniref:Signal peptidase I n=1 Tax=Paenibacillus phoenicis TaxID=554117 RepID=A0ABU5PIV5_9BACL|nr:MULTISPECIES: signal peptidase I [Paenibacillus]MCT2195521.1 signal peptidase I [Paenibacillus sp. p3-SID1389]MEA3569821.1 signal peptidase I [Paenibacillus phoenicis]
MKRKTWWKELGGWGFSIVLGFVLSMIIGIFIIQPYKVDGHSMEPTLTDNQRIYAWKFTHVLEKLPAYGDIVIIDSRVDRNRTFWDDVKEHPIITWLSGREEDDVFYVKRVIGLPGDTIEVKDGHVFRNGQQLEEPYIKEQMDPSAAQVWHVPENHVFVMGDNRNNSNDSRSIGPVPLDHVMGIDSF